MLVLIFNVTFTSNCETCCKDIQIQQSIKRLDMFFERWVMDTFDYHLLNVTINYFYVHLNHRL